MAAMNWGEANKAGRTAAVAMLTEMGPLDDAPGIVEAIKEAAADCDSPHDSTRGAAVGFLYEIAARARQGSGNR